MGRPSSLPTSAAKGWHLAKAYPVLQQEGAEEGVQSHACPLPVVRRGRSEGSFVLRRQHEAQCQAEAGTEAAGPAGRG